MKVAFLNTYGQSGLSSQKLLELENFIECNRLDIVCLQETDIQENTFSGCSILNRFIPIINNCKSGYGTCTLVRNIFTYENVIKDSEGRLLSVDVENMSFVNLYLHSGTDQASRNKREDFINNIPNILLYKKKSGLLGGDMNSIVDKKDALNYPEQKMSKCFKKLINLYKMSDTYRNLYPHSKQFSRYYVWKGKEGATRIDRCYTWGNNCVQEAEYLAVSFSDHLAHVITFDTSSTKSQNNFRKRSLYKIKHFVIEDAIFQNNVRDSFQDWLLLKDGLSPTFWWENIVKPGIKEIALSREKEINGQRRRKIAALQLRLSYHLRTLKNCTTEDFVECVSKLENVKAEIKLFYQERAKIILLQNRAEVFDMSDETKLYHYESLNNYVTKSEIKKIEVNGCIYEGQDEIENAINRSLEDSMSETFTLDLTACENLFSFQVPQITESMDNTLSCEISLMELKKAIKQLNSKASPGMDGIPSTLYEKLADVFTPYMLEVFNFIIRGEDKPTETMRTSTVQFLSKPKKANSIKLTDKRKISVLCTDFKCLETVLANRLNSAMPQFISDSQFASKPRKIHQGISAARDLVSFAEKESLDMALLALDMKSGFDFLQMDFVYFCMRKYGFSDMSINIFKNVYGSALALSVVNGQRSKLIRDLRETLRQGGSGSMQIFNIGVNPLIQQLENQLQGVTLYSLPVFGPIEEHEEEMVPMAKRTCIIGYVDDLNPVITKVEEFDICHSYLILFERASGCKFHRDPSSQKCKITPLGEWKKWLNQETVPLPFLLVSDHLEILGVKIFENWSKTRQTAGNELKQKIKCIRDAWRGGRFYDFLIRPHVVNTYLFSNIWHKASAINLLCGDMDKIQSEGNDFVFADCYLRPEKPVNYIEKREGGLQIQHVRSKAMALFIKNLLEESFTNIYLDAVVRKYCLDEEVFPVPVRPHYLDKRLITTLKLVLGSTYRATTKDIYHALMRNELSIDGDFKLRIESIYDDFSLGNILEFTHSKFIPLSVRSHMWKIVHRIEHSDIEEAKVKLISPSCKYCGEQDIDRVHLYFQCERVISVGKIFLKVLRIFDPQYTFEEVLDFKGKEEHPQLYWFIALTLFYIDKNKRCSSELYRAFLWSELETLKMSKHVNDEMLLVMNVMLELLDA